MEFCSKIERVFQFVSILQHIIDGLKMDVLSVWTFGELDIDTNRAGANNNKEGSLWGSPSLFPLLLLI